MTSTMKTIEQYGRSSPRIAPGPSFPASMATAMSPNSNGGPRSEAMPASKPATPARGMILSVPTGVRTARNRRIRVTQLAV
jgi:hypothetical protein